VTYGTKPVAFLAIRAMHQPSYDEEEVGTQLRRWEKFLVR